MTRSLKLLSTVSLAAVLALATFSPAGRALAQSAPAASHDQHTSGAPSPATPPPAPGNAAPPAPSQGAGMPTPGGSGMMGMMGMMQSGGMPMPMMASMMEHASIVQAMEGHTEGRLAFLKAELAITEAQLPVWNAYADAMRAETKRPAHKAPMGQAIPAATWLDRLAHQEHELENGLDTLRRLKGVSSALYGALSAAQKKLADALLSGPLGRM